MRNFRLVIILLILVFLLPGCSNPQPSQDTDELSHLLDDFSESIANGIPSDMSLTIYHAKPSLSTDIPLDEDGLISWGSNMEDPRIAGKVVLDSTQLSSQIDQLKNISSSSLRKPLISRHKDLRLYYYIGTETDGKVLEVGMYSTGGTMYVNGVEVKYDPVFFDLVSPYLVSWKTDGKTD